MEKEAAKQMPGKSEAKYSLVIETSASTPNNIKLIDGGIKIPKVPPAAIDPK